MIFNRGKPSVPTIINVPDVIPFSLDKAKIFTMNFASAVDD